MAGQEVDALEPAAATAVAWEGLRGGTVLDLDIHSHLSSLGGGMYNITKETKRDIPVTCHLNVVTSLFTRIVCARFPAGNHKATYWVSRAAAALCVLSKARTEQYAQHH